MAADVTFYLNNTKINWPFNAGELSIELNYDKDVVQSQVKINDWRFVRENTAIVNKWIADGLVGGVGVFEGIPFDIEVSEKGQTEKPFTGYLDLTELKAISCSDITVSAKERAKIDWLNDIADSFTFEYLYEETKTITGDDFIFMPYVISTVPNYKEVMLAALGVFAIGTELAQAIAGLSELAIEMANPFEASAIVRAVVRIAYLILLIISLIKLIKDLIALIIQPQKYHACMKVKTLFEKGCEQLGLTFKSPLFDGFMANLVLMPEKRTNPPSLEDKRILGFLKPDKIEQRGYFNGTFGDFLRAFKTMFNAKIIINDSGELWFVRRDYNLSSANYIIPPVEQPFHTLNTKDFNANYLIEFQSDVLEKNTIQEYTGTTYQVTLTPKATINSDLVLMKGYKNVSIPFALAKRKDQLTVPEQLIKDLLDGISATFNLLTKAVNALIKIYNKIAKVINKIIKKLDAIGIDIDFELKQIPPLPAFNLAESIEDRYGMMKLETDFIQVPKLFIIEEGSTPRKNNIPVINSSLSAKYLWDNYHFIDSFVPTTDSPNANQYIIKTIENVPFCMEDYLLFKNNNGIYDSEGNEGFVDSLTWNPLDSKANITYRVNKLYTDNLKEVKYEPTGK